MQLLVTTNQSLPFWSETHSGNKTDKEIFEKTILQVQEHFKQKDIDGDFTFIADSALYSSHLAVDF